MGLAGYLQLGRFAPLVLLLLLTLSACANPAGSGSTNETHSPSITVTTSKIQVAFTVQGSGQIVIDWNGEETEKDTLPADPNMVLVIDHDFGTASLRTIRIEGNITLFECGHNDVTNLDVTKNPLLKTLGCRDNSLAVIDLTANPALTSIDCTNNNLMSLDVSKNPALTGFSCDNNNLTSLNVSANPVLNGLMCRGNNFTESALIALFNTLPSRPPYPVISTIYCDNNPGYTAAEASIKAAAAAKNWTVKIDP